MAKSSNWSVLYHVTVIARSSWSCIGRMSSDGNDRLRGDFVFHGDIEISGWTVISVANIILAITPLRANCSCVCSACRCSHTKHICAFHCLGRCRIISNRPKSTNLTEKVTKIASDIFKCSTNPQCFANVKVCCGISRQCSEFNCF